MTNDKWRMPTVAWTRTINVECGQEEGECGCHCDISTHHDNNDAIKIDETNQTEAERYENDGKLQLWVTRQNVNVRWKW